MTLGDVAREILAQFNEQFARSTEWRFWGPHYVTYDRGEWTLRPFGRFANERYSFWVRKEFGDDTYWVYVVLC